MKPAARLRPSLGRRLRRNWALLVVVVAWLPVLAQTPPLAGATGPYGISGTVVNGVTGDPLQRASVAVLEEADSHTVRSVETDNEGRFVFERLPAAKFQLIASKRGFRTAFYDEHENFSTAIVTGSGLDTSGFTFRLMPGAALHGVITGDGGDQLEGAKVMLFRSPRSPASPGTSEHISRVDSVTTDDTGAYEFDGLAAGEYLLAVSAEPWFALHHRESSKRAEISAPDGENAALDVAYPVTFFDSTTDEAAATRIQLADGRREEANISLRAVPALRLGVASPQKQDGSTASATLRQTIFGTEIESEMLIQGPGAETLEFSGVAPGRYQLVHGDPPRITELEATASQQVDARVGVLAQSVSAVIKPTSGSSLPDDMSVTLTPLDGRRYDAPLQATPIGGAFRFPMVARGNWELWVENGGIQLPILSVSLGGKTLAGNRVTVKDRPLFLVVNLNLGGTRIEGFVRNGGKGVAGAMVVLVPKDPADLRWRSRRDQTDSDGSFSLHDVAPGEYRVVAIEDGWELDWARAGALNRFLDRGIAVTVTGNSGKKMELSAPVPAQAR